MQKRLITSLSHSWWRSLSAILGSNRQSLISHSGWWEMPLQLPYSLLLQHKISRNPNWSHRLRRRSFWLISSRQAHRQITEAGKSKMPYIDDRESYHIHWQTNPPIKITIEPPSNYLSFPSSVLSQHSQPPLWCTHGPKSARGLLLDYRPRLYHRFADSILSGLTSLQGTHRLAAEGLIRHSLLAGLMRMNLPFL
jgi:hypothetical protein